VGSEPVDDPLSDEGGGRNASFGGARADLLHEGLSAALEDWTVTALEK
jgi:hypothetical protein